MVREKIIKVGYDEKGVYVDVNVEGTVKQSNSLRRFLFDMIEKFQGIKDLNFYINLENCQYVDSTFIGLLLILNKKIEENLSKSLIILKPSGYVLEVIKQMGLENILCLEKKCANLPNNMKKLEIEDINKLELAIMMYMAHSELANVNDDNKKKFETAINMLKKEMTNEGINVDKLDFS